MENVRHILVATDFSPASERALENALDLASRFQAKLTILHVYESPPYPYVGIMPVPLAPPTVEDIRAGEITELESTLTFARARCADVTAITREGTPWREILTAIRSVGADVVIMGSHGRRGLPRMVLGSVAEHVVRESPVPVLTVHGAWFEDRTDAGKKLGDVLEHLRGASPVVVAITRGGLVVGREVAAKLGAPLDLLLTRPLVHRGRSIGALSEDGDVRFDAQALEASGLTNEERDTFVASERHALAHDLTKWRGTEVIGDLWQRSVVVVTDEAVEPWRVLAAIDAIERMRPARIVVATPVASEAAFAALGSRELVTLHKVRAHVQGAAAYRHFERPADATLSQLLRASTNHAA